MNVFNANRVSNDYPEKLRHARETLGLSQTKFAAAAGYSGVMQGRYETERSKSNSATPSERTAKAIKEMIETVLIQAGGNASTHEAKSLKSASIHQIEQAIASALCMLIGAPCKVGIKDLVLQGEDGKETAISLVVSYGPEFE